MAYENNDKKIESVYSARIRAGKRRTYFFDVRATRGNDYYLTITESRKKFNEDGYERHKLFLYKEDFNKFIRGLIEAVEYVKTDLMPDFDFDAFNHDNNHEPGSEPADTSGSETPVQESAIEEKDPFKVDIPTSAKVPSPSSSDDIVRNTDHEEVDKW